MRNIVDYFSYFDPLDKEKLEGKSIGAPNLDEVKPPAEIPLIFEFYSR